jgi:hypothetical protein
MEIVAWTGVGILALLIVIVAAIWINGILSDPIGRTLAAGLTIMAIAVWGVIGGIYLIVENT